MSQGCSSTWALRSVLLMTRGSAQWTMPWRVKIFAWRACSRGWWRKIISNQAPFRRYLADPGETADARNNRGSLPMPAHDEVAAASRPGASKARHASSLRRGGVLIAATRIRVQSKRLPVALLSDLLIQGGCSPSRGRVDPRARRHPDQSGGQCCQEVSQCFCCDGGHPIFLRGSVPSTDCLPVQFDSELVRSWCCQTFRASSGTRQWCA
mmetsp:Transcript_14277/g.38815  ORF Transcript_14277/g.38815 Transcript_14277/m.38815 type:complete len:210 (-) Transcript_14277:179-808(-)